MEVKMILPALTEAESSFRRAIKYSLFPPLGLAILSKHDLLKYQLKLLFYTGGWKKLETVWNFLINAGALNQLLPLLELILSKAEYTSSAPEGELEKSFIIKI